MRTFAKIKRSVLALAVSASVLTLPSCSFDGAGNLIGQGIGAGLFDGAFRETSATFTSLVPIYEIVESLWNQPITAAVGGNDVGNADFDGF